MKKMFAASLVAIMAVSAANAEIASVSYTDNAIEEKTGKISDLATTAKTNLTAAVNELVDKVGTQDVGTQVSTALTTAKGYTDTEVKKLADGAVKTNTDAIAGMDLESTGTADSFIQTVAQEDGTVTATATAFDSNINDTSTVAPQTKAIKSYVDNKFNTISDNNGSLITRMDTLEGRQNLAQDAIDDLQDKDTELAGLISSGDSTTLNSAKAYTDTLANGAVAENTAAIAAINNETTGILAKAAADAASKDTALETKITDAYEAADASLKTELEGQISTASGAAGEVASDLAEYIESNDAAVTAAQARADKGVADAAAAKTQADKGVADAAAAKTQADKGVADAAAAQAAADANTTAISKLGETYATDAELNTAKSDIKTAYEAADATTLSDAKTYAKDYADGLAGNYATAAQGDKADSALQQADVTTGTANGTIKVKGTDVSVAGLGTAAYTDGSAYATAAQGAKADTAMQASELKDLPSWSSAGCATGTCSLVSKSGTIQWEAVRYAEE